MPADAETTFDDRHPRWRQRRLRVRPPGCGARPHASRSSRRASWAAPACTSGCIPTKALLHAAEVADAAREGEQFGVKTTFESVDMTGVNALQGRRRQPPPQGPAGPGQGAKIDLVEGAGRLVGPHAVEVDGRQVTRPERRARDRLLREVAARPRDRRPHHDQRAGPRRSTSCRRASSCSAAASSASSSPPSSSRFGSEVTIVEALPRLVAAEDEAISKQLERSFRKRKIAFKTGVKFAGATQTGDTVPSRSRTASTIEADLLLVAVGRGPVTEGLGYEEAGVTLDRGFVPTDERLRTNVEGVYAVGDIVPGLQLAHRGFAQGIFVAEEIAGLAPRPSTRPASRASPTATPRSRSVGLTEAQAAREVRRRRDRTSTTSAATASPRSCRPRASSSSSARRTARSSAST